MLNRAKNSGQWLFPFSQIKLLECNVSLGGYINFGEIQDNTVPTDAELIVTCLVCRAERRRSMHSLPVNKTDIKKVGIRCSPGHMGNPITCDLIVDYSLSSGQFCPN